jgi:apolipoprotein N-acyltransferase
MVPIAGCQCLFFHTEAPGLLISRGYGRGMPTRPAYAIAKHNLFDVDVYIKVAVVQGNILQSMKWDRRHARFIMQTYSRITLEASRTNPALIIWPESSTPGPIGLNRRLHQEVRRITKEAGNYLLLGSSSHQKLKTGTGRALSNSAFLFSPNPSARKQQYDKICLFPFGEYLPMENTIPWAWINVPDIPSFSPGKNFTVFQGPGFRFGVTICWEILFPEMIR